jgi:peptide/nickel transport system permease protein
MSELALGTEVTRRRVRVPTAWRQPLAVIGTVIAIAWIVIAIFAPLIAPHDPLAQNAPPAQSPSLHHLFGTDELGRDVFSRVIYGSRVSLPIGLALVVVAWPSYARVVRGLVLSVGDSEYVQTSRLLGATSRRTLVRDVLPNVAGPVLVLATLDLANAILLLSGLSFLGLGAQPPQAEWGSMVAEGTQYFQWWWIGTFPGLAIFTVVLAFNFIGDSLRDVFDPRTARRPEEP